MTWLAGTSATGHGERVLQTTQLLRAAAMATQVTVSADMRVSERDAAQLMAIAAGHLKALRQEGKVPQFFRAGVAGSRISYRLAGLAEWIESQREDFSAVVSNDRQRTGYVRLW